ncbi:MAG: PSD1 domain-containing protein [Planctomycetia bacterium]|nr:PSD1 domain-containing protein [Planctomycetia bacterium]
MPSSSCCWILSVLFVIAVACETAAARGDDSKITPEDAEFFEQKIRPLLVQRCYSCHAEPNKIKGGLRLDSRGAWQKGGETGPALVPGKPAESLLIQAVRYGEADLQMPPTARLPDAEIALLEEWVRRGAPDPRDGSSVTIASAGDKADAARTHWAYQPLQHAKLPAVRDAAWPRDEIDLYILAALEERGLHPSRDADRHAWLRRVTFDLTGLPPTADEIRAFDDDRSNEAWEHVVDHLLASRAFGERWARPWLDLVGYADQIGSANNVPAEYAWRYRDYVIRSFQADKPFDVFVREQLAGDLLLADTLEQRQDQLTATGFLVLGNVNIVEADKLIMQMDIVDQQIEKFGKTFLGMTLNCARCHDHKFDPLTLRDYYGLTGIFASTDSTYKTERGVWSSVTTAVLPESFAQFTERETAQREHDKRVAAARDERAKADLRRKELEPQIAAAKANQAAAPPGAKPLVELEKELNDLNGRLNSINQRLLHLNYLWPAPPLAYSVKEGPGIFDARIQVRGNPHVLGESVPRGFVQVATHGPVPVLPPDRSGRVELAEWLTHASAPLLARVTVNRVWQRLFGRGIVASVDYFGVRGEAPTHPQLLDGLAGRFIGDGWSQKRLIRRIVLSRTYRQQSEVDDSSRPALAADPENRYLWRMSPRRLDAEMLRDAVLAVSGELRPIAGGPGLAPEFLENVGGLNPKDVNPISFSLNKFRDEQRFVRTIYLPVVRSSEQRGPADVLNFFDFAQPARISGDRPATTVASQALFLLNGPLLKEGSQKLATRLLSDAAVTTDDDRIGALYLRILNRVPSADDVALAREFLSAPSDSPDGAASADVDKSARWQRLIHALFASNEFLFRL